MKTVSFARNYSLNGKTRKSAIFQTSKQQRTRNEVNFVKTYVSNSKTKVGLGIDLGTTNSCIAIVEANKPRVLENEEGLRTTPSVVTITAENEYIVGREAKNQIIINPKNTFYATKRLIGRSYNDPIISQIQQNVNYEIVPRYNDNNNQEACLYSELTKQSYTPTQIASFILTKMKKIAEKYLSTNVDTAVVTVPAYFNDAQRQATKEAGKLAGLNIKRIFNEPTAAALAYGIQTNENKLISVFDLGGGTFDISILSIEDGIFEVRATNGDTFLGGDDFDQKITNYIIDKFKETHHINLRDYPSSMQRIRGIAESVKIELTNSENADINIPYIIPNQSHHLSMKITRSEYHNLISDLLARMLSPCEKCVRDANISLSEISEVILVGGMTRDPFVIAEVEKFFGKKPFAGMNPDESVAVGAAFQAAILEGEFEDFLLLDVNPLSLGIEMHGGLFERLIKRNSSIPTEVSQTFTTGVDWQSEVAIKVYQGEREMVEDNKLLGEVKLPVTPSPKGVPQIKVTFKIDANGIVNVTAIDLDNQSTIKQIQTESIATLSKEKIENILHDSEENMKLDQIKKEKAKAKLSCETEIAECNLMLKRYASHLDQEDIDKIKQQADVLQLEIDNADSTTESLQTQRKLLQDIQLRSFENSMKKNK